MEKQVEAEKHARPMAIGVGIALLGLVLWLTTDDVETPILTLTKVGLVLMVVGVIEVGVALFASIRSRVTTSDDRH